MTFYVSVLFVFLTNGTAEFQHSHTMNSLKECQSLNKAITSLVEKDPMVEGYSIKCIPVKVNTL